MANKVDDPGVAPADGGEAKSNWCVPERLRGYFDEIDEQRAKIEANNEDNSRRNAPYRDQIKAIKKAAADAGVPRKEFNAAYSRHRKIMEIDRIPTQMDEEQQDTYQRILEALGDDYVSLPLGAAAVAAAGDAAAPG